MNEFETRIANDSEAYMAMHRFLVRQRKAKPDNCVPVKKQAVVDDNDLEMRVWEFRITDPKGTFRVFENNTFWFEPKR